MIEFFDDDLHLPFIKRKKVCSECNKEKFLYEFPPKTLLRCSDCQRILNKKKRDKNRPLNTSGLVKWNKYPGVKC